MNPSGANTQLDVTHLSVFTASAEAQKEIIHDVSFSINRREALVLLGESGSGKTILSRSLTKLFPPNSGMHIEGSVHFEGQQLLHLGDKELSFIRRRKIRYILQEPMQSLNPLARIRAQLRLASDDPSTDEQLNETLRMAGLNNSEEVLDLYPHQLSIGMAQKVCIAMAVLPAPSLLIADEPTSAVDSSQRYALLDLLASIRQISGSSLIFITHDLDMAGSYGDRIVVVYGGRIVESSPRATFFDAPLHPYSRLLIDSYRKSGSIPTASNTPEHLPAREMPGTGCRFSSRCPIAEGKCRTSEPELGQIPDGREVRCFYWK